MRALGLPSASRELEAAEPAGLLDDAGLRDVRADARHARHDVADADRPAEALGAFHAVLEGEDRRALGHQRQKAAGRAFRVAHLDREQDGIRRRNLARVGHHLHGIEVQRAQLAVQTQTVSAHRLQMRATRDEGHVVAGRRQARAEVAADAARAHHRELHGVITTRPTILPARRSSSERLVSPSARVSTGIGATLPALTRSSISRASLVEPT